MNKTIKKVTFKKVSKFFNHFDGQCSDGWITDILNEEINLDKLKEYINNDKKYPNILYGVYTKGEKKCKN